MSFDEDARKKARVNWLLGIVAFVALCAYAMFFFGWLMGFVVITPVIGVAVAVFSSSTGQAGGACSSAWRLIGFKAFTMPSMTARSAFAGKGEVARLRQPMFFPFSTIKPMPPPCGAWRCSMEAMALSTVRMGGGGSANLPCWIGCNASRKAWTRKPCACIAGSRGRFFHRCARRRS